MNLGVVLHRKGDYASEDENYRAAPLSDIAVASAFSGSTSFIEFLKRSQRIVDLCEGFLKIQGH